MATNLKVEKTTGLIAFADNISDEDVISMMQNKAPLTNDMSAIPPNSKNLVLWAKDPNDFISNINFKTPYPEGFVYTQYSGTKSPSQLKLQAQEGCSWVDITSDYAGLFFRAYGGASSTFSDTDISTQNDAIQEHKHSLSGDGAHKHPLYSVVGTSYKHIGISGTNTSQGNTSSATGGHSHTVGTASNASTSNTVRTATETRPKNTTMRIWKVCSEAEVLSRLSEE